MSASTCTVCKGARLKPEALAVTVAERNIHELTTMSVENAESFFARVWRPNDREKLISAQILKEIGARLGFLTNVGLGYLNLVAQRDDAVGRRIAAHPAGDADRQRARRRAVHLGRTVDRAASARQRPALGDAQDAARHRQHAHRHRTRRRHDARRRRHRRHRAGRGRRGRARAFGRFAGRDSRQSAVAHGRVSVGPPVHRDPQDAPHAAGVAEDQKRNGQQPARDRRRFSDRRVDLRDRCQRFGQIVAGQRGARQSAQPVSARSARGRDVRHAGGRRSARQDGRDRPIADRTHAALESGDVYRHVRSHSRTVSRSRPKRRCAATRRAASRSTSKAAAASHARATASSRSRCTFCPTSTCRAKSARAAATTRKRSK